MFQNRRAVILIIFIIGVCACFWLVSRYPALSNKAAMSGVSQFEDPLTNQAHFSISPKASFYEKVFYTTLNWYETNWRGMAFGLVIAAGFLSLLSCLPKTYSDRRLKNSFVGMLVGTPLGVCVNCVAPIAKGIYEAGSRTETALAVMFSSPTLNIVVLTMLFTIFPLHMALLKLGATFVLILLIVPLISKNQPLHSACSVKPAEVCEMEPVESSWRPALFAACRDYWKSLQYIVIRTVPLMLLAGFLGALLSHLWSFDLLVGLDISLANLGFVALMGTFLPLPIAFDIMLAQTLMMSGLPDGFVMASLFTFGTFSVYSAMIVYRTFSLKLAAQLFTIVTLMGVGLGYAADFYSSYRHEQWLAQYDRIMIVKPGEESLNVSPGKSTETQNSAETFYPVPARSAHPFLDQENISIDYLPHADRIKHGDKPFSKYAGKDFGITYSNILSPEIFFDPFFFGRGIASGDINRDGWADLAVATNQGFEIYQNMEGKSFRKILLPYRDSGSYQVINIALVDIDNNGWLDIFYSTYGEGNHVRLNPLAGAESRELQVPNGEALLTSAAGFADLNGDGFLDIVQGNYFLGILTQTPLGNAVDQLVLNKNLNFDVSDLEGIPGQTHSVLISDFNGDTVDDLIVGNDYRVADTYYLGDPESIFKKLKKSDGVIPITTENTMSVDTGDMNNDLIPDIYLANIGFSRGLDVVSNIFGDVMRETGINFCESGESVLDSKACHTMLRLVTLLNPEKQDITERCTLLETKREVRDCMVTRMALLAARKRKGSLCQKIGKDREMGRGLCDNFFKAQYLDLPRDDEMSLRPMSNIILKGTRGSGFEDVSESSKTTTAEWSWNARFADLDNDEWQDLYVVNGVLITQEFTSNNFFHNQKGETFTPAEKEFGLYDRDHSSSYTYIDIDRDGDLDIITNTLYGPFKVYMNNNLENNSATFRLEDGLGNRFCIGCKVIIHYGEDGMHNQFREIKAGGGFHSYDEPKMHFGLGKYTEIENLEIIWSTGETTIVNHPFPANREYLIKRKKPAGSPAL